MKTFSGTVSSLPQTSEKFVLTLVVMNFFKVWQVFNPVSKCIKQDGDNDDEGVDKDENMLMLLSLQGWEGWIRGENGNHLASVPYALAIVELLIFIANKMTL